MNLAREAVPTKMVGSKKKRAFSRRESKKKNVGVTRSSSLQNGATLSQYILVA